MLPPPPVVRRWLWLVAALTATMVVVGGYVRLTRAGLSIVEWNVITGILPPIGDAAWLEAFARYQQSPEGRTVNAAMTLDGYQRIFLIEWFHRLLARAAGLAVVLPLVAFIARGTIPWRRSLPYWAVVAGFGLQGLLGWLMVASGLVDRPSVSHYRLTAHLLAALALMATCIWLATVRAPATAESAAPEAWPAGSARGLRRLGRLLLLVVVVQIAWGGLMAGLKAGHASDTWPLIFGRLVPEGLFATAPTPWQSILEVPLGVHWVHRWLAWVVLAVAVALAVAARRAAAARVAATAAALVALIGLQIAVGVAVVVLHVPLHLALFHQATGVAILALAVYGYRQLPRATR